MDKKKKKKKKKKEKPSEEQSRLWRPLKGIKGSYIPVNNVVLNNNENVGGTVEFGARRRWITLTTRSNYVIIAGEPDFSQRSAIVHDWQRLQDT